MHSETNGGKDRPNMYSGVEVMEEPIAQRGIKGESAWRVSTQVEGEGGPGYKGGGSSCARAYAGGGGGLGAGGYRGGEG